MAMKKYRPITPTMRYRTTPDFAEITSDVPEKSLLMPRIRISGRNVHGRITMRRRGGGHKRMLRIVDFKRAKVGVPAKVAGIHYDPNRTARLALLHYADGEKTYILCPVGLALGAEVLSGPNAPVKVGNALPLATVPVGEMLHNVELQPGRGAVLVRSAGTSAQLMAKAGKYALLRMPSGEQRRVLLSCMATIGVIGNADHSNRVIGKAGASRWLGRRPKVRGVAMNPVDHPHGGGEGKTSGGRHPCTPWGISTKGHKTRNNKLTDKFIVRRKK